MFPDDAIGERWFEEQRWPEGHFCPHCGPTDTSVIASRRPMPYDCRDCQEFPARHNIRDLDTIGQLSILTRGMGDTRLRYRDLVA